MRSLVKVVVVLAVAIVGCKKPNPAVCCESEADCASIGVSDPERGCALGLVCSDHECSVPPDGPKAECTVDEPDATMCPEPAMRRVCRGGGLPAERAHV